MKKIKKRTGDYEKKNDEKDEKNDKGKKIQKDGQQPKGPTTPDPKGRVKTELPMTGISFFGFGGRPVKKKEKKRNKDR